MIECDTSLELCNIFQSIINLFVVGLSNEYYHSQTLCSTDNSD